MATQYYIAVPGGTRQGPIDEEIFIKGYRGGAFPATALAWTPGMAEWQPVTKVMATLQTPGAAPVPTPTPYPAAGSTPYPTAGSTPYPTAGSTPYPAAGPTPYPTAGPAPYPTPGSYPVPGPYPVPAQQPQAPTQTDFYFNPVYVFKNAFTKGFYNGRGTRREFWMCILWTTLIFAIFRVAVNCVLASGMYEFTDMYGGHSLRLAAAAKENAMLLLSIGYLAIMRPMLVTIIRRMHDIGVSGAFCAFAYFFACFMDVVSIGDPSCGTFAVTISTICGLVIFIIGLIDSQRGSNKFGASEKYPA